MGTVTIRSGSTPASTRLRAVSPEFARTRWAANISSSRRASRSTPIAMSVRRVESKSSGNASISGSSHRSRNAWCGLRNMTTPGRPTSRHAWSASSAPCSTPTYRLNRPARIIDAHRRARPCSPCSQSQSVTRALTGSFSSTARVPSHAQFGRTSPCGTSVTARRLSWRSTPDAADPTSRRSPRAGGLRQTSTAPRLVPAEPSRLIQRAGHVLDVLAVGDGAEERAHGGGLETRQARHGPRGRGRGRGPRTHQRRRGR